MRSFCPKINFVKSFIPWRMKLSKKKESVEKKKQDL